MDGEAGVLLGRQGEPSIHFRAPIVSIGDEARIPIRIMAPGFTADGIVELDSWSTGFPSFAGYFWELAESWRGWSGERSWNDDGGTFSLVATHDGKGLVTVSATARSGPHRSLVEWTVTIAIPIEPGSMEEVAHRISALAARDIAER